MRGEAKDGVRGWLWHPYPLATAIPESVTEKLRQPDGLHRGKRRERRDASPLFQSRHPEQTGHRAAIEVHRDKGPGLIEPIYEWCLTRELELNGVQTEQQRVVQAHYKGFTREEPLRFDLLVERCLLIETKSVGKTLPIHQAQLLSYMKLLNVPVGLLINFNAPKLTDGISRLILPGANL